MTLTWLLDTVCDDWDIVRKQVAFLGFVVHCPSNNFITHGPPTINHVPEDGKIYKQQFDWKSGQKNLHWQIVVMKGHCRNTGDVKQPGIDAPFEQMVVEHCFV